jgi:hypothetical protein
MKIKRYFDKLAMKVGITIAKRMSPVIKEAVDNPENLKFEGYIEGDEIIVRIKIKNES